MGVVSKLGDDVSWLLHGEFIETLLEYGLLIILIISSTKTPLQVEDLAPQMDLIYKALQQIYLHKSRLICAADDCLFESSILFNFEKSFRVEFCNLGFFVRNELVTAIIEVQQILDLF